MKTEKIFNILREQETLSTHEQIDIENAIDCGQIDSCDIVDDFKNWLSENADYSLEDINSFEEHFCNLLSYKENLNVMNTFLGFKNHTNKPQYYFPFSEQRKQLRLEWNGTNTDWNKFLTDAELRAQKVKDAIGEPIFKMNRAEVENKYNDLYKNNG